MVKPDLSHKDIIAELVKQGKAIAKLDGKVNGILAGLTVVGILLATKGC